MYLKQSSGATHLSCIRRWIQIGNAHVKLFRSISCIKLFLSNANVKYLCKTLSIDCLCKTLMVECLYTDLFSDKSLTTPCYLLKFLNADYKIQCPSFTNRCLMDTWPCLFYDKSGTGLIQSELKSTVFNKTCGKFLDKAWSLCWMQSEHFDSSGVQSGTSLRHFLPFSRSMVINETVSLIADSLLLPLLL